MVANWLPFQGFRKTFPQVKCHANLLPSFTPHFPENRPQKGDFGGGSHFAFFRD